MKVQRIKATAATILSGGLMLATGCLPQHYWSDLLGTITADVVTTIVEGAVEGVIDADLPGA